MDLLSTSSLFQQFLNERRFLRNVTPSTIEWYDTAFKAFQRTHGAEPPLTRTPLTRTALQAFVVDLRQRGVKPVSCNTYIKALNAFCKWCYDEQHLPERLELAVLKLEKRVVQTLSDEQMQALLSVKPRTFDQHRLHALIAFLLDTGVRIDEALTLRVLDVDFDNLLVTVFGKGRKERRIPFSFELRKVLYRWQQVRHKAHSRCEFVFPSRQGTTWDQRNSLRGLHLLQQRVGLPSFGWHRLRHTFATNWLREGGDIARLSLVLGHSQITTTQRYLHLLTGDLIETQQRTSVLNRLRP